MHSQPISLDKNAIQVLEDIVITVQWLEEATALQLIVTDAEGVPYSQLELQRRPSDLASVQIQLRPQGALGEHLVHVIYDTDVEANATFQLHCETSVSTDSGEFDGFYSQIRKFMAHDTLTIDLDGKQVYGYRSPDSPMIWIRDHAHQMKGFRYFEPDVVSAVEFFLTHQMPDGSIYDFIAEDGTCKRVEVEADVEYLVVEAAFHVWQVTGDLDWVRELLPNMEAALRYTMTSPLRWSEEHGLVKRAFTIDTWDFAYTGGEERASGRIRENEPFCIMHGDNTGFAQACNMLGTLFEECGQAEKANYWRKVSADVVANLNKYCWNGKFYTHQVHIDPVEVHGVDETKQLSLSNSYGMNRGVVDHERCVSIIREYMERRATADAFAEWFSIDPPFPVGAFGYNRLVPGAYVNGGIMPLVGGELARATFDHGFETYGVDILRRYKNMIEETGETYLWYFPSGEPSSQETSTSPEALPTDGWGSSAMLYAFIEGLCGVVDLSKRFEKVKIAPRWGAAEAEKAQVRVCYGASPAYVAYEWEHIPEKREYLLRIVSVAEDVDVQLLLPNGVMVDSLSCNGKILTNDDYDLIDVEESVYAQLQLSTGNALIKLRYR
ncbi:MAG: hypothetical protein GX998_06855 [Firmicutes bacterium]|nr:hypothetical protein [Bacillota bacterium]